ncbi:hypothetical protein G9A89_013360 [Geosiphon pyriformis]|nr:hypothetical protein G9A89_013360 [Geosiphon pyriformis]
MKLMNMNFIYLVASFICLLDHLYFINIEINAHAFYTFSSFELNKNSHVTQVYNFIDGTLFLQTETNLPLKSKINWLNYTLIYPEGRTTSQAIFLLDHFLFEDESKIKFREINILLLSPGYIYVEIFSHHEERLYYPETNGSLFDASNGKLLHKNVNLRTKKEVDMLNLLVLNIDPTKNFIYIENHLDEFGWKLKWSLFNSPQKEKEYLRQIQNGTLDISSSEIFATFYPFPTIEGGYGMAYVAIKTRRTITQTGASTLKDISSYAIPEWFLYVTFLEPGSENFNKPVIVYQSELSLKSNLINIDTCSSGVDGTGYSCILRFERELRGSDGSFTFTPNKENHSILQITFLSTGAVSNIETLQSAKDKSKLILKSLQPLPYGGFLALYYENQTSSIIGMILNNNYGGNSFRIKTLSEPDLVSIILPNNTLYCFQQNPSLLAPSDYVIDRFVSIPLKKILGEDIGFHNLIIESSFPAIGSIIKLRIKQIFISFRIPVQCSSGNASIFQENNGGDGNDYGSVPILRQTFSAKTIHCSTLNDSKVISIDILPSTFNLPNAKYFIQLDNNFVQSKETGEALFGTTKNTWWFSTESVKGFLRLTVEGTRHFYNLQKEERSQFFDQLLLQIAESIPIPKSRLFTEQNYQQDPSVKDRTQIIFLLEILSTNNLKQEINVKDIITDLNTMMEFKEISPFSKKPLCQYLDETYGFQRKSNLLEEYKFELIGGACGIGFLGLLYLLAWKKNPQGDSIQIFKLALIITDLGLDISFIFQNGRDVPWLFLPSIIILIISIVFNSISAFGILISEIIREEGFGKWFQENSQTASIFTLIAAADIGSLEIFWSDLAGFSLFSAPFSNKAQNQVFWGTEGVRGGGWGEEELRF